MEVEVGIPDFLVSSPDMLVVLLFWIWVLTGVCISERGFEVSAEK